MVYVLHLYGPSQATFRRTVTWTWEHLEVLCSVLFSSCGKPQTIKAPQSSQFSLPIHVCVVRKRSMGVDKRKPAAQDPMKGTSDGVMYDTLAVWTLASLTDASNINCEG